MISIVIPVYNGYVHLNQLLYDIYRNVKDCEVIVANDKSPELNVQGGFDWWTSSGLIDDLKIIHNPETLGFLKNCNQAVKQAKGDIVLLLNSDVRLYDRNIPDKIMNALTRYKEPTLAGANLLIGNTGWNKINGKIYQYLEGWFLAFRKNEWEQFGGFDERYAPHVFEDIDLSTTYLENGGKLVQIDADVVHVGGQSIHYTPERDELTKINQRKFAEKWTSQNNK